MRYRRRLLLLAALSGVGGCVQLPHAIEHAHFKHVETGYELAYRGEGPATALGEDWRLDNYVPTAARPDVPSTDWRWKPRKGREYELRRSYDVDDDGEVDRKKWEPVYDLRWTHRRFNGVITLQSLPLSARVSQRTLRSLAERFVENASGAEAVLVRFGEEGPLGTVEQRWAAQKLSEVPCTVAEADAYAVDLELSNVDRVVAGDARPSRKVRLVLIDPGYSREVSAKSGRHRSGTYKLLLLATYSNDPRDFDTAAADFTAFLNQLKLKRARAQTDCAAKLSDQSAKVEEAQAAAAP